MKDEGYRLELESEILTLHGALVCVCGDIPASNFLGGFKEGVGFALRKCRQCLCTKEDFKKNVSQKPLVHKICNNGGFSFMLVRIPCETPTATTIIASWWKVMLMVVWGTRLHME